MSSKANEVRKGMENSPLNHQTGQPVYAMNQQPVVIPGLKVAYGAQALYQTDSQRLQYLSSMAKPQSWLDRLKNTVVNMVTEEAEEDRPIGIAQLSRNTFTAHRYASPKTVVKGDNQMQDYRFRLLTEPRQR